LSAAFLTPSLKLYVLKNPFKIVPKIFFKLDYDGSGKQITIECLTNLGFNLFLPPLGVAPQLTKLVSTTCFQKSFALS
jgi:hypothetical protein